jgi:hypothetical protein
MHQAYTSSRKEHDDKKALSEEISNICKTEPEGKKEMKVWRI